ncbi:hypothetical protein [Moorena sp. SIO3A5]|uniref:hypothetical protein n=1 Tax=Moorena sp. SIO3A5 TaxID=2607822 RepID=UPI00141CD1C0|nr:hypothetical protein [Moorena sp. SIO3A5]NEP69018.1 hypothetical protein [Moorena sp. SIO3A5]
MTTKIRELVNQLELYVCRNAYWGTVHLWEQLCKELETDNKYIAVEKLLNIHNITFQTDLVLILTTPEPFQKIVSDVSVRYSRYSLKMDIGFRNDPYFHNNPYPYLINRMWLQPLGGAPQPPRSSVFNWFTAAEKGFEEIYKGIVEAYPSQDYLAVQQSGV